MAPLKKHRYTTKKKTRKTAHKFTGGARRSSSVTVPKTMVDLGKGFPKKITMTHKYFENVNINSVGGALATYAFSTNGMYDPVVAIGGHQPMYFDQLAALYARYVVIGAKISVKFLNADANTGLIACGIVIDDDYVLGATNFNELNEQTQATRPKYIAYNATTPVTQVSKWSARKFFASSQNIIGNSNLGAAPTSNPSQQSFFVLYAQCIDLASTVTVFAEVSIEYIAVWTELKDVTQS